MAKKTKKYADGGDIYEGTPLARAMGVRGVAEPGLEAVYPEQYMGGVGSIKGVGGSAVKAAEEAAARRMQEKALNRANRFATGKIREYTPEEKAIEAARLRANVNKIQKKKEYTPRASEEPIPNTTQELTGKLGGKGGLKFDYNGMEYKKGGAVKKMAKGGSTASKRADGCAIRGKTRGRNI